MEVQVEKTGACACKVSVSIATDDVDQAFAAAVRKLGKSAQIPGFRPGKAPRGLIERHFAGKIQEEVQTQLVESTLYRALDEHKLMAVSLPRLEVGQLNRGAMFTYTAEVEIRPEITLARYQGLAVPAVDTTIAPEAVEEALQDRRKQAAQLVPVTERNTVREGDVVQVDFVGRIGGTPFPGGQAENAMVEIGGSGYIPGFAEGLVGATVPGERDVAVTFPDDYAKSELAGQAASFAFTLKELKARELPELDDEFAKDEGHESLAALREQTGEKLRDARRAAAEGERRKAVLTALVAANPLEVPPSMVESQIDRIVAEAAARVERMVGQRLQLDADQLAGLRENSREDALFQVRSGLLLMEVAKTAEIKVEDDAVAAEVEVMAEQAGEHAERLRAFYDAPERCEDLRFQLLEDRVVGYLLEHAVDGDAPAPDAAMAAGSTK